MSGLSSYEEGVNIEELIDLIDQEDTVDSVAKSALKNRLEKFNKGPVIFIQRAVAILGNSKRRELDRKITYQLASQEISKWQEAVNTQRSAEQLDLTTPLPPAQSLEGLAKTPGTSALAQDINQLLGQTETPEEENRDEEAPERAKMRSVMFYQYLKQKRRAKIKSKLYHKIHKKKKEKEQQLNAPSLSEEQRAEMEEFQRAQERMSLKHTKGSKFKKLITRYAKYEGDVRNSAMQDNENLVQRIKNISRISSEGNVTYDSSSSDDEAFLAETLKIDLEEPLPNKGVLGMKFMQEAMKKKRMREKEETEKLLKELKGETVEEENEDTITSKFKFDRDDSGPKKKRKTKEVREILNSKDEQQQKLIEKAFEIDEMDEVANEEWEKEDAEQKAKEPKKLKGWGSWTGSNIKTLELPPEPAKFRTEKLIVNSERDKKAAKYLVKRLPAPYKSARQYDSVHKIPLSKQLNSKRVFQQLIQPEILTRPGDIIEPLSQEFKERKVES